jgi:hypothetical protein
MFDLSPGDLGSVARVAVAAWSASRRSCGSLALACAASATSAFPTFTFPCLYAALADRALLQAW